MEPERRVRGVTAPQDSNAELEDRQEGAANGIRMPRPSVEVVALDQQDRSDRLVADLPDLSPEATTAERTMEVGHGLALDNDSAADPIVAGRERLDRDACAEALESRRDTAPALEYVRDDYRDGVDTPRVLVPHTAVLYRGNETTQTRTRSYLGPDLTSPVPTRRPIGQYAEATELRGTSMTFTRITVRPDQMGGVPCIRGLRIPVATVVDMVADGMAHREILAAYPDLEAEDIEEALHYAAEAVRERELPLSAAG